MKATASSWNRAGYVVQYAVIPGWAGFLVFPRSLAWVVLGVLVLLVGVRAYPMGISVTPDLVIVRNFWRRYELNRSEIVEVERVANPPTIDSWVISVPCYRIRTRAGERVYVISSEGGYPKVMAILRSLGVPVETGEHGIDFGRLWRKLRRK